MKDEYIRKQDAVDYCKALMNAELVQNTDDWGYGKERYNQTEVILEFIENRQPVDVAPVVHAYWIDTDNYYRRWRCSACSGHTKEAHPPFCPFCGAKMER